MSPDEVKKLLYDMALLNENEWDGDYNLYLKEHGAEMTLISSSAGLNEHAPQFFDFAYDADIGVSASTELSAIQQAENLINRMEHGATVFTDDERNLIVNYNYKLDDMEKTRKLAEKLAYMIENQPVNEALTVIDAQAEIDALPDGRIGLSEMHEYGYSWNEELMEKTEAVERERLSERIREEADSVVADFKAKTEELFNGINGQTQDDIEQTVWAYLQSKLDEYEIDVELVDVVVSGSRCRGLEKAGSDLDVVVEYKGREHEDDLFNVFNEDGLMIGGVKVDINPITEGKTGTLATYLPEVESYLAEKQAMQKASAVEAIPEKTITLTVAECGEFHSLGEFHENIASVEEAIAVWKSIPPERMNGIPSIGINIHTEGTERYEDVEMDILSGKVIDLEVLDYVPDITDEPKAIEVIAELIDKLPDIEVRGSLEKWQAAILASQIDQFSYDYDTYQYQDTVEDREAQVANITEDIRNGNTGYLNDFLNAVISEGVREGITDIFGEGVEIDDSEAVQTARRAKELLDKLAEYKPLAKVEELEEQNYNMIDNVLNNGAEKKEQEQIKGRISIKEKLAEKKAVIEQRDKAERTSPEKETEKKSQREM